MKWLWWLETSKFFKNADWGAKSYKEYSTNSPELSLLKLLSLDYHHSHFLVATLDFTSFFTTALFDGHTIFLQQGCFGLDFTSFCIWYGKVGILPSTIVICFILYIGSSNVRVKPFYLNICLLKSIRSSFSPELKPLFILFRVHRHFKQCTVWITDKQPGNQHHL